MSNPPPDAGPGSTDLLLVGGGLANALIAWRLRQAAPAVRLRLIEAGPTIGGNHTWSFHDADLTADQHAWVDPLVAHRWTGHTVQFGARARRLGGGYRSVTSERLHEQLMQAMGPAVERGVPVTDVYPTTVRCTDGRTLHARAVIDGRGHAPHPAMRLGHQKFVGLELQLDAPHGLTQPILMDAQVAQLEGYRFVYTLPLGPRRLLVEDTYYTDAPRLDSAAVGDRVRAYARSRGWSVAEVVREEQGVLPIALDGDIDAFWRDRSGQPCSGLRAGLFHPTTGYSFGAAVRLADLVAERVRTLGIDAGLEARGLAAAIEGHARQRWKDQAFFRTLNRLLFIAAEPAQRHRVMQHFYRLPEATIERFYADRLTPADRLRILVGKPPVALHRACAALCPPRWFERPAARSPA